MTKTVCLLVVIGLIIGMASMCAAETHSIPVYDGKPGERIGDVRINPKDGAEMVWVPAGEFLMGSTAEQIEALIEEFSISDDLRWRYETEIPQRTVYLDGYWVYKYPVTVGQYRKFCEDTGRDMPGLTPSWGWVNEHPVVNVTWYDAAEYAEWAGVSMTTEAQWEKAARGTDGRIYPWGNEWDSSKSVNSVETMLPRLAPVGSIPEGASPYGAMDMNGQVWEFCSDWYDPDYYSHAPDRNPTGSPKAVKVERFGPRFEGARVVRGGGSWIGFDRSVYRSAYRLNMTPLRWGSRTGFRCAANPQ